MLSIPELLEDLNESIAARRRTLRTLETPRFQAAYKKASNERKKIILALVSKDDQDGIENWMREQLHEEYEAMSSRELRALGRQYGVAYYAQLPRATLVAEILAHAKSAGHAKHSERTDSRAAIEALCNGTAGSHVRC